MWLIVTFASGCTYPLPMGSTLIFYKGLDLVFEVERMWPPPDKLFIAVRYEVQPLALIAPSSMMAKVSPSYLDSIMRGR